MGELGTKEHIKNSKYRIISVSAVVICFLLWYFLTKFHLVNEKLIPSPYRTWTAFVETMTDGYKGHLLVAHLGYSMRRLMTAFLLAVVTAVPTGLLCGYSRRIRAAVEPFIEFYRPLPPLAYYTLLTLAFGIGDKSKIALLFLACFAPIFVACVAAVKGIKAEYIQSAYSLGASRWQLLYTIILPSCLPNVFTGLRTAIGVGYSTLVAAEMVAAATGIGWLVVDAGNWFRNDLIFVGIFVMGFTGIFIDWILRFLERKIVPWKGRD